MVTKVTVYKSKQGGHFEETIERALAWDLHYQSKDALSHNSRPIVDFSAALWVIENRIAVEALYSELVQAGIGTWKKLPGATTGCSICGLTSSTGIINYVCPRIDCPSSVKSISSIG